MTTPGGMRRAVDTGTRPTDSPMTVWARASISRLASLPSVRRVGVALIEGGGRQLHFTSSDRLAPPPGEPAPDDPWCLIDAYDDVPLTKVVRTGSPVLGSLDQLATTYAGFVRHVRRTSTRAVAAIPITRDGTTVGGAVLYYDRPQPFDDDQLASLRAIGSQLGTSLRRAQRARSATRAVFAEPTTRGARTVVHQVPRTHDAVAAARSFLSQTLAAWHVDPAPAEDAVLCLSELVTNALVHSETGCAVRVVLEPGTLTVAVRDGGAPARASVEASEDLMRVHGRGLQIVDALAAQWGSDASPEGTTVWFRMDPGHLHD